MEYDLDVITLPYDSLNIEDIVVSNFTILARSGNTIYKSTDDGENWKIAFESELKVNQLYSKDPHTILLVGEKGMVYRTMDYGETWLDERVDTDSTLIKVAARNYQDYVALAETRWLYHKFSPDKDWLAVNTRAAVYVSTITSFNDAYYFGGGMYEFTEEYRGTTYYESFMPGYLYKDFNISRFDINHEKGEYDSYSRYNNTDSLKFFNVKDSLFIAAKNKEASLVTSKLRFIFAFGFNYSIKYDVVTGISDFNDTIYIFTRSGSLERVKREDVGYNGKRIDAYDLNIDRVNQIKNPYGKVIYIASNNSRIYKMSIYEPVSSIQVETNNLIKQYNDRLWVDDEVELLGIYNYIGQKQNINRNSNNYLEFKQGIYYLSFKHKNNIYNHKIMVN
ncbi:MAG: hypothetical protein KDC55_11470 [Ignavibacteriae bacterium]|nr:hypothetical protein [Ignavibacteriota bacterium]